MEGSSNEVRASLSKQQLRVIERERKGKTWRVSDWEKDPQVPPTSSHTDTDSPTADARSSGTNADTAAGGDIDSSSNAGESDGVVSGRQRSRSFTAKSVAVISAAFSRLRKSSVKPRRSTSLGGDVAGPALQARQAVMAPAPSLDTVPTSTTRRRRGFSFAGVSFAGVLRRRQEGGGGDAVASLPPAMRRRWSSFSGETSGSRFDGSSYDDEADNDDTRGRNVPYLWQLAPEHERPRLVELRRQELLDLDLAADAALHSEWMHILRYRAERTFANAHEDARQPTACGGADISEEDVVAITDVTAVELHDNRIPVLVIRMGGGSSEADGAVQWAEADTWLWNVVRSHGNPSVIRPRPGAISSTSITAASLLLAPTSSPTIDAPAATATSALAYLDLAADPGALSSTKLVPINAPVTGDDDGHDDGESRFGWEGDASRMERRRAELLDLAIEKDGELQCEWLALLAERSSIAQREAASSVGGS